MPRRRRPPRPNAMTGPHTGSRTPPTSSSTPSRDLRLDEVAARRTGRDAIDRVEGDLEIGGRGDADVHATDARPCGRSPGSRTFTTTGTPSAASGSASRVAARAHARRCGVATPSASSSACCRCSSSGSSGNAGAIGSAAGTASQLAALCHRVLDERAHRPGRLLGRAVLRDAHRGQQRAGDQVEHLAGATRAEHDGHARPRPRACGTRPPGSIDVALLERVDDHRVDGVVGGHEREHLPEGLARPAGVDGVREQRERRQQTLRGPSPSVRRAAAPRHRGCAARR